MPKIPSAFYVSIHAKCIIFSLVANALNHVNNIIMIMFIILIQLIVILMIIIIIRVTHSGGTWRVWSHPMIFCNPPIKIDVSLWGAPTPLPLLKSKAPFHPSRKWFLEKKPKKMETVINICVSLRNQW